jgi:lipopolysaccharide/colanic/teichoic acid biosynthesis glycosyltransferase
MSRPGVTLATETSLETADRQGSGQSTIARRASLPWGEALLPRTAPGWTWRRWGSRHRALLVGTDLVALVIASWLGVAAGPAGLGPAPVVALVAAWLVSLATLGTHNPGRVGSGTAELRRVLSASARVALVVLAVAFVLRAEEARGLVLVTLPLGTACLLLGRAAARGALLLARRQGYGGDRVVAVGTVLDVLHLIDQARRSPSSGFRVVAACVPAYDQADRRRTDNRRSSRTLASHGQPSGDRRADSDRRGDAADLFAMGVPILGAPHQVLGAVASGRADSVVVAGQGLFSRHALRRLAWQLEATGTRLFVASALSDVAAPRITVRTLAGLPLLQVEAPVFGGGQRLLKSAMDRVMAATLVLLLAPLLLLVSALVAFSSPGGVLYRQERIGIGERPFRCLKFRTMRTGAHLEVPDLGPADQSDSVLFKMRADPRVTPVGRVLRRCSLDELPQLFNVLGGSMSLVGPRPPLPGEVAAYGHDVRRRLLVKPGMTGLWQVSGRSDLSWAESVRLDLYYVENWSPTVDLKIMARTVLAVAGGRGAY